MDFKEMSIPSSSRSASYIDRLQQYFNRIGSVLSQNASDPGANPEGKTLVPASLLTYLPLMRLEDNKMYDPPMTDSQIFNEI